MSCMQTVTQIILTANLKMFQYKKFLNLHITEWWPICSTLFLIVNCDTDHLNNCQIKNSTSTDIGTKYS